MAEGGKVGCLLRLEPNAEAKVRFPSLIPFSLPFETDLFPLLSQLCRLTVRTTNDGVSQEMLNVLATSLAAK
jgi:AP-2 complex subunit alpha